MLLAMREGPVGMVDDETTARILAVLEAADGPLTAGHVQRHLSAEGRDVPTGVIREACGHLADQGRLKQTDELPTRYRLREA